MSLARYSRTVASLTMVPEQEGPLRIQALVTVTGMVDGAPLSPVSATFREPAGTANYVIEEDVRRISTPMASALAAAGGITGLLALLAFVGKTSTSRRKRGKHAAAR